MASQCINVLTVNGNVEELIRFMKVIVKCKKEREVELLSAFYPVHENQKETSWGISGDAFSCKVLFGNDGAKLIFETFNREPKEWLKFVAASYPKLNFLMKFYEPEAQYVGIHKIKGNTIDSKYFKEDTPEYMEISNEINRTDYLKGAKGYAIL